MFALIFFVIAAAAQGLVPGTFNDRPGGPRDRRWHGFHKHAIDGNEWFHLMSRVDGNLGSFLYFSSR